MTEQAVNAQGLQFRDIAEAKLRGDAAALSRLSIKLAWQRLHESGCAEFAVVAAPTGFDHEARLNKTLKARGLRRMPMRLSWDQFETPKEGPIEVLFVPLLEPGLIAILQRRSKALAVSFGDERDLAEAIRRMFPDRPMPACELRPWSFADRLTLFSVLFKRRGISLEDEF